MNDTDNAITIVHYRHRSRPRPALETRRHLTLPGLVAWSLFCGVSCWVPVWVIGCAIGAW